MPGGPIKVLHVVGAMDRAGRETWLVNVLRHIDRQRFEFHFCALSGRPGAYDPEIQSLGGRVIPLKLSRNPWAFAGQFRRILREGRYDVVHAHSYYFCGYLLRLAAKEGIPRRIAHAHTTSDARASTLRRRAYRWLMGRWIARYATRGLAASHAAAQALFGPAWESDPRISVLRCGVDLEALGGSVDREAVRVELGIPPDAPVVGHVGRFEPAKNHRAFVAIAEVILRSAPEARFVLVGDGSLRAEIEAMVRQRGMSDHFLFCGIRSDVPRLLVAMDVFLFPSLWEGLAVVLLEAQAAGVPVIASDIPGVREGIAKVEQNHLFPLASLEDAATAVTQRLTSRTRSRRLLDPRVAEFLRAFDIRQSVRELEAIYA